VKEKLAAAEEKKYFWLHDAYIDPFVYHLVLQHPFDGVRAVTISHQEYAEFVFPLLCHPLDREGPAVRATAFRHQGWGWVLADSTKDHLGRLMPVDCSDPAVERILAECALLSGYVQLGPTKDQLDFLGLFVGHTTQQMQRQWEEWQMQPQLQNYWFTPLLLGLPKGMFPPAVQHNLDCIGQLEAYLHECVRDAPAETILQAPQLSELSDVSLRQTLTLKIKTNPALTVRDLLELVQLKKVIHMGKVLLQKLLATVMPKPAGGSSSSSSSSSSSASSSSSSSGSALSGEEVVTLEWKKVFDDLLSSPRTKELAREAKTQLKVIASRHCPGINQKLPKSPMWLIINAILRHNPSSSYGASSSS
jgi:hypothetical protein